MGSFRSSRSTSAKRRCRRARDPESEAVDGQWPRFRPASEFEKACDSSPRSRSCPFFSTFVLSVVWGRLKSDDRDLASPDELVKVIRPKAGRRSIEVADVETEVADFLTEGLLTWSVCLAGAR